MLNEIPTPSNILGSNKVASTDISFDGSQVPYWLGGTQGMAPEATTSVGPVAVPAASTDPTLEDFFNPYSPLFYNNTTPNLPVVATQQKKNNIPLYIGIGIIAFLLVK